MDSSWRKNDEAPMAATIEASNLSATTKELTMNSVATQISTINVPFHGDSLYLVSNSGEPFVPMKPVVENMGLAWQPQHEKLKTRFSKGITEIVIPTKGGDQSMTCLAFRKFAGWLHTINVGKVRPELREKVARYQEECDDVLYEYWTKGEVKNPRKKTTVDDRTPLRDAVNMLVGKKGLRYDDAYTMVHQRFNIDSIDELEFEQIPLAVEYIHRVALDGELMPREVVQHGAFTPKELDQLVWLWDYANRSQAVFRTIYPPMKQIKSQYSGRCFDYGNEFSHIISLSRDVLLKATHNINLSEPDGPTNLAAWMRLKNKELPQALLQD